MIRNPIPLDNLDSKLFIPVASPAVDEAIGAFARYLMKGKITHESVITIERTQWIVLHRIHKCEDMTGIANCIREIRRQSVVREKGNERGEF